MNACLQPASLMPAGVSNPGYSVSAVNASMNS
jgi:hypothetical protein